jgi:hypothetical protein
MDRTVRAATIVPLGNISVHVTEDPVRPSPAFHCLTNTVMTSTERGLSFDRSTASREVERAVRAAPRGRHTVDPHGVRANLRDGHPARQAYLPRLMSTPSPLSPAPSSPAYS